VTTIDSPTGPSTGLEATEPGGGVGDIADLAAARPLRKDVWKRFRRNKLAMFGVGIVLLLVLTAAFAPAIAPYDPETGRDSTAFRQGPSADHWFGTDTIGLDVFSRVVYGARISLKIGVIATVMSLVIGLLFGAIAGFFGGATDTVIMRTTDIGLAIPYIVLAAALASVMGKGVNTVILVIGITGWLGIARIVRSSFLSLKQLEYVEAAHALGYSRWRVMFRHILPNALQPIIVYGTITVGSVILAEAALSFLQVGPVYPTPSWGLMVSEGKGVIAVAPHMMIFPGLAIILTVLAFVFIGDGLRDALDPKLK
jgi:ABC-type dipeptide/oligopeptide/nickel transport system permease subunit